MNAEQQAQEALAVQVELARIADDLENRGGNEKYRQAWKVAARIVREHASKLLKK